MDWERWLETQSERVGVPVDQLRRAFQDEISGARGLEGPYETPDRIIMYYKYAHGETSRFFRELRDNQRIYGSRCPKCRFVYCPPRAGCSECYAPTEWVPLSGEGTIVTCTRVFQTTAAFLENVPYVCAYVRLDGADTCMFQNVDTQDARPGMRVRAVFRPYPEGAMSDFVFKPV